MGKIEEMNESSLYPFLMAGCVWWRRFVRVSKTDCWFLVESRAGSQTASVGNKNLLLAIIWSFLRINHCSQTIISLLVNSVVLRPRVPPNDAVQVEQIRYCVVFTGKIGHVRAMRPSKLANGAFCCAIAHVNNQRINVFLCDCWESLHLSYARK